LTRTMASGTSSFGLHGHITDSESRVKLRNVRGPNVSPMPRLWEAAVGKTTRQMRWWWTDGNRTTMTVMTAPRLRAIQIIMEFVRKVANQSCLCRLLLLLHGITGYLKKIGSLKEQTEGARNQTLLQSGPIRPCRVREELQ